MRSEARIMESLTAYGATAVRGRVRAERQTLERSSALQLVAGDARWNYGGPAVGVKLFNPGQVTRRVDNHRNVHRLTAHRRARAACEYGYIRLMACTHHRDDIFDCARQDDAYRNLSVVRCFG